MAKICWYCKQPAGWRGQFIKVKNPEQSTGATVGKAVLKIATGFSRDRGFWVCKECRKNRWNNGEPVYLRFSDDGEVYAFTK